MVRSCFTLQNGLQELALNGLLSGVYWLELSIGNQHERVWVGVKDDH
ncbi:MAG: hypothetical protein IPL65_11885 [Lewinellaceae bacterium]|nr:hypothetical protein [Lewinellaceae bacterium]